MPDFASKLYTDCDTNDGDSGAALYDSGGKAIGFAAYRTAYGETRPTRYGSGLNK